jgi:hypothetical protein
LSGSFVHRNGRGSKLDSSTAVTGELGSSTTAEVATHAQAAVNAEIDTLHFYTYGTDVKDSVWSAVAKV